MRRRAHWLGHAWATVCGIAAALFPVAVGITILEADEHRLAVELAASGHQAVVTEARPVEGWWGDGHVEVTFRTTHGRFVTTGAAGSDAYAYTEEETNLTVRYRPGDPERAMLTDDIPYYAEDAVVGGLTFAGLCVIPLVGTAAVWLARGRPDWRRYMPDHLL